MNSVGKLLSKFFKGSVINNMTSYEPVDNLGPEWYTEIGQKLAVPILL